MKQLVLILCLFSASAYAKCVTIHGIFVTQKFSSGEFLIQYRNGWTGLTMQDQRPKYDVAVLKLYKSSFDGTGRFNGVLRVSQEETTVTIDGFDRKVPWFKETDSCK